MNTRTYLVAKEHFCKNFYFTIFFVFMVMKTLICVSCTTTESATTAQDKKHRTYAQHRKTIKVMHLAVKLNKNQSICCKFRPPTIVSRTSAATQLCNTEKSDLLMSASSGLT